MEMPDTYVDKLLSYLVKRPWSEVNDLIVPIIQARQVPKVEITTPEPSKAGKGR